METISKEKHVRSIGVSVTGLRVRVGGGDLLGLADPLRRSTCGRLAYAAKPHSAALRE